MEKKIMRKLFVTSAVFDRTHCIYLLFHPASRAFSYGTYALYLFFPCMKERDKRGSARRVLVFQPPRILQFLAGIDRGCQVISSFRHHLEVTNDLKKQDRATYCSRSHKIEASDAILLRPLVLSR